MNNTCPASLARQNFGGWDFEGGVQPGPLILGLFFGIFRLRLLTQGRIHLGILNPENPINPPMPAGAHSLTVDPDKNLKATLKERLCIND